jgi:hypothetical protein
MPNISNIESLTISFEVRLSPSSHSTIDSACPMPINYAIPPESVSLGVSIVCEEEVFLQKIHSCPIWWISRMGWWFSASAF